MKSSLLFLAFVLPASAYAHESAGSVSGFVHPFSGLDHVLAMLALGLWAGQRGGRALWVLPGTFVAMIAIGGFLGASGIHVPFVEHGIVVSVIVLALLVAVPARLSLATSAAVVGLFALFHGHAHGVEMPANASGLAYGAGFMLASAVLHGIGVAVALRIGLDVQSRYPASSPSTGQWDVTDRLHLPPPQGNAITFDSRSASISASL